MQIDTITTLRIGRTAAIRAVAVAAVVGTALLGAGCGDKKDRAGSRTAATVDKHEITVERNELIEYLVMASSQYGMDPNQFAQAIDAQGQI
ncbi:MAG TPA: hypothetical protein PLZ50_08100, partial [Rubrivivax sp.]|nr:hypothetical protein [Rubrivivax sp.]